MAQKVSPQKPATKEPPKRKGVSLGYIFMGIIIILLLGIVGFFYQEGESERAKIARLERNAQIDQREIEYYKTDLGEKVAEIEAKQYANSKELKDFEQKALERIEVIGGNVKKVSNYIKFTSQVIDSMRAENKREISITDAETGEKIDTVKVDYNDGYMVAEAGFTATDKFLNYSYTPSYEVVSTWKKPEGEGLGSRKRLMVDIVPTNPKETVTEASSFEVMQPKLKFYETKAFWSTLSAIGAFLLALATR